MRRKLKFYWVFYVTSNLRRLKESFYLNLACKWLPKRLVLWCYIVVAGSPMDAPCFCYKKTYDYYKNENNIKDM